MLQNVADIIWTLKKSTLRTKVLGCATYANKYLTIKYLVKKSKILVPVIFECPYI